MTEKRFKHMRNRLGMQFICYDDMEVLLGTFADKDGINHIVTLLNDLSEENEQLKQYIYDNLDEDICDVCSYQYLEKSQMDKYYVAKCKKGYDNCSKGTVIHCKDFKFKELQE